MQPKPENTIYLLHFPNALGRVRHYLGITRTDRLAMRLREHAHRRGAALTAALASVNTEFVIAWTMAPATYADERRLKDRGHYSKLCPVCRSGSIDHEMMRVACPDLPDLGDAAEHVGLGLPLRGVHRLRR